MSSKKLFKSIPPPFVDKNTEEVNKVINEEKPSRIKKDLILVVFLILLNGGLGSYFYIIQQAKEVEILLKIEEVKIKIQELGKIEAKRLAEKQKMAETASQRQLGLQKLNYEYNQAITNLRAAEIRLNEMQKFKLLRSAAKKQEQIQQQLEYIMAWKNEVDRLKNEIDNY